MSAKFECFTRTSVTISEASKLAQTWRASAPATRRAACKRLGNAFSIAVEGTRTTFQFYADGSVKTINATAARKTSPFAKIPMHMEDTGNRAVLGFVKGKVIYA